MAMITHRLAAWQNSPDEYRGHDIEWDKGMLLRHHSGRIYEITGFANTSVDETEKFLHHVEYKNIDNGTKWSHPVRSMVGKFEITE